MDTFHLPVISFPVRHLYSSSSTRYEALVQARKGDGFLFMIDSEMFVLSTEHFNSMM